MAVVLIAAVRKKDFAIGNGLDLIYDIMSDKKFFRNTTLENIVIMGHITWNTIDDKWKPLDRRVNGVMSRSEKLEIDGVRVIRSIEEALRMSDRDQRDTFIAGGEQIYQLFLPYAEKIILSVVEGDDDLPANIFFPKKKEWIGNFNLEEKRPSESARNRITDNFCNYSIETYVRK